MRLDQDVTLFKAEPDFVGNYDLLKEAITNTLEAESVSKFGTVFKRIKSINPGNVMFKDLHIFLDLISISFQNKAVLFYAQACQQILSGRNCQKVEVTQLNVLDYLA